MEVRSTTKSATQVGFRWCRRDWGCTGEHRTGGESQRDSVPKPRLARRAYPGDVAPIPGPTPTTLRLNGIPPPQRRWGWSPFHPSSSTPATFAAWPFP